ncbi:alpha-1,4-N-acetylglucosaminyltransferase-like [Ambystoma mexicanum]|uniref:alpha-1,4-N-acetylglucosaminyltransferase-like n=1 Tax=Ambystoma mexicanum TaxID=8296 RepID=UPI0037E8CCA7
MKQWIKSLVLVLAIAMCFFIYWARLGFTFTSFEKIAYSPSRQSQANASAGHAVYPIIPQGPGIFFIETTDRLTLPSLVACSIESAARTYPDRHVYFLMKGLDHNTCLPLNSEYRAIFLLASMKNVNILPLRFEELFRDTPLEDWYLKANPLMQFYWTHHVSDACREALLWKYGGIYMDTDVISIKPIPVDDFLAAESLTICSSAVLGFRQHHPFVWDCMKDFVENYDGTRWGQQGPLLFTRMAAKVCGMPDFEQEGDGMCHNVHYLQPKRFYPIPYNKWEEYYQIWTGNNDLFKDSYALHFWNHMNTEHKKVIPGSNTVAEHLFMKYCPLTYDIFVYS